MVVHSYRGSQLSRTQKCLRQLYRNSSAPIAFSYPGYLLSAERLVPSQTLHLMRMNLRHLLLLTPFKL